MISKIYSKALGVLAERPFRLWGISLLSGLLAIISWIGFGIMPAIPFVVCMLLETGMAMIFLNTYRTGLQPKAAFLFSAFKKEKFLRVAGGTAWAALWIFLWALIPVVGWIFAIIRVYRYRFVPYILMTRDDVSATDAIKVSTEETMGYKGQMFGADILIVLGFVVLNVILNLLAKIPGIGILFTILYVLVTLVFCLFGGLFFGIIKAAFYVEIKSAPAAEEAPVVEEAPAAEEPPAAEAAPFVEETPSEPTQE